jgi:hypothetical protein
MIWEFSYHKDDNYLEVIVSGNLSTDQLNQMARERWNRLQELNCNKVLFDFTRITSMLATIDIYHRPEETENVGIPKVNRTAAVVPTDYWRDFRIMESAYQIRGYDLHVFLSKEDALNYLIAAHSPEAKNR